MMSNSDKYMLTPIAIILVAGLGVTMLPNAVVGTVAQRIYTNRSYGFSLKYDTGFSVGANDCSRPDAVTFDPKSENTEDHGQFDDTYHVAITPIRFHPEECYSELQTTTRLVSICGAIAGITAGTKVGQVSHQIQTIPVLHIRGSSSYRWPEIWSKCYTAYSMTVRGKGQDTAHPGWIV